MIFYLLHDFATMIANARATTVAADAASAAVVAILVVAALQNL